MQEAMVTRKPGSPVANAIGGFFVSVVKSCYDMEFYRKVRSRPWPFALRYSAIFHAAIALYATAVLGSSLFGAETAFIAHVTRTFPADAKLEVKSGHLSTNLPEPFEAGSKWLQIVVDTSVTGYEMPKNYEDMEGVLVGRDAIFMPKPHYTAKSFVTQRRVYRMEEFSEFTVTKAELLEWLRQWGALFILGALVTFAVVYWLFLLALSVLYALVASLVTMAIGLLFEVKLSYEAWFAVGLHAVTLPMLVGLATTALGIRLPFAYTVIFMLVVGAVLIDERNQPVAAQPAGPAKPLPSEPPALPTAPPLPPPTRFVEAPPKKPAKRPARPKKKPPTESAE